MCRTLAATERPSSLSLPSEIARCHGTSANAVFSPGSHDAVPDRRRPLIAHHAHSDHQFVAWRRFFFLNQQKPSLTQTSTTLRLNLTMDGPVKNAKIKLTEINSYITCYLCKGYLIDATTISECLHSFCRSCIIKFLQENSHCPVCEVMINKAKPNIKLDKTLQDIVYKLVPELFLREMRRRQRYYRDRPVEAARATPEERGEDTERTIFSPSDTISLSIEYISDDSTPGAIAVPPPSVTVLTAAATTTTTEVKSGGGGGEQDPTVIKRYLQCPGMCRVDVLKKFVRNKYNVDTNRFYIDVLYKKVPLPDHYTLIDIAYIYSWKRNEPMKFFFRISDINTAAERFDYLGPPRPAPVQKRPAPTPSTTTIPTTTTEEKPAKTVQFIVPAEKKHRQSASRRTTLETAAKKPTHQVATEVRDVKCAARKVPSQVTTVVKRKVTNQVPEGETTKKKVSLEVPEKKGGNKVLCAKKTSASQVATEVPTKKVIKEEVVAVDATKEITEIKNRIQKEPLSEKSSVYTNITLNRSNNVEIITKIQKVSNKSGQPIGLNIIKQTVKKSKPVVEKAKVEGEKKVAVEPKQEKDEERVGVVETAPEPILPAPVPMEVDLEKSIFLKSIELTAKNSLPAVSPQKVVALDTPPPPPPPKLSPSQKRKNSSPVKKRAKVLKLKTTIPNLAVRQIVSNVNQSATNVTKIVERNAPNKDLQTLFDNCKINIPSSLSITLKESSDSDGERRTTVPVKPVQNYIEILRLPDATTDKDNNSAECGGGGVAKKNARSPPQTFQKTFEDAIKKPDFAKLLTVPRANKREQKTALDLSGGDAKQRKKDAQQQQQQQQKVAVVKHAKKTDNEQSVDCHSPSLGMNYKVSVGQQSAVADAQAQNNSKVVSSSTVSPPNKQTAPPPPPPPKNNNNNALTPNQLLQKYDIKNLAQLTATFNLNASVMAAAAGVGVGAGGGLNNQQQQQQQQFAALQHVMLLKQFEIQNRQNWLSMNPNPFVQYEKYLQSLQGQQSHLVGKEN